MMTLVTRPRWRFRVAVATLTVLTAAANAQPGDLGCTVLSDLVRLHTVALLRDYTGGRWSPPRPAGNKDQHLETCDETVLSVSRGFSAALSQFGMPVRWSYRSHSAVCRSRDIAQCFPFADPAAPPVTIAQMNFIGQTWRGLSKSVKAHMPWGSAGNLSYFTADSFVQSLEPAGLIRRKVGAIGRSY